MIRRVGSRFEVEVYNPRHDWRLLGVVARLPVDGKEDDVFITHFKRPESHFYIKGQGYPINEELLCALRNARVAWILIPESGKTGFRVYLGYTSQYRRGLRVKERFVEEQRVIPLSEMTKVDVPESVLRGLLYG